MKEIGGYIELDTYNLPMLHENAIALNCGRNALAYLIEARNIEKIYLPYFLCDSVINVCRKYNIQIRYYHIASDFTPIVPMMEVDEWLYIVNSYGQLSHKILKKFVKKYPYIIIDNAQDYFAEPISGIDTLYTCRKYFGVADGAFLYTDAKIKEELPLDESFERMHFLLGRFERNASEFYSEAVANNMFFATEPIRRMSQLTNNLLHAIDYKQVERRRIANFNILADIFQEINQLETKPIESSFMYPLLISNGDKVKQKLQIQKIYIPTLWPNVLSDVPEDWIEWNYARNILPIPCDQRYDGEDMEYLGEVIKGCIN